MTRHGPRTSSPTWTRLSRSSFPFLMNNPTPSAPVATNIPRRDFLKTGVAVAAAAAWTNPLTAAQRARSIGANDRIRVAQLGCGSRGVGTHMKEMRKHVQAENFAYVAVADTWRVHREEA